MAVEVQRHHVSGEEEALAQALIETLRTLGILRTEAIRLCSGNIIKCKPIGAQVMFTILISAVNWWIKKRNFIRSQLTCQRWEQSF